MTGLFEHDTPADREKRINRMIGHIRHAEYLFATTKPKTVPTPGELIWTLFQDAVRTARNTPDLERQQVSKVKSLMPAIRDTEIEWYRRAIARLAAGMSAYDSGRVRETVSEADIERMVDVMDLLRFVRGRDAQRSRRTVLARAGGLTIEQCGWVWDKRRKDFDRRAMYDIRQRVIGQVLKGIETHFGLVRTSRSFRRHIVRNIEMRKRAEGAEA